MTKLNSCFQNCILICNTINLGNFLICEYLENSFYTIVGVGIDVRVKTIVYFGHDFCTSIDKMDDQPLETV